MARKTNNARKGNATTTTLTAKANDHQKTIIEVARKGFADLVRSDKAKGSGLSRILYSLVLASNDKVFGDSVVGNLMATDRKVVSRGIDCFCVRILAVGYFAADGKKVIPNGLGKLEGETRKVHERKFRKERQLIAQAIGSVRPLLWRIINEKAIDEVTLNDSGILTIPGRVYFGRDVLSKDKTLADRTVTLSGTVGQGTFTEASRNATKCLPPAMRAARGARKQSTTDSTNLASMLDAVGAALASWTTIPKEHRQACKVIAEHLIRLEVLDDEQEAADTEADTEAA